MEPTTLELKLHKRSQETLDQEYNLLSQVRLYRMIRLFMKKVLTLKEREQISREVK